VVCPVCSTQLKVSKPLYQEIAVLKLTVWDVLLPIIPALTAGAVTYRLMSAMAVEPEKDKERARRLKKALDTAVGYSGMATYMVSFLVIQGVKRMVAGEIMGA
jgi:hypothetical protein